MSNNGRCIQVYDGSETQSTKKFFASLENEITRIFGNVEFMPVKANEISESCPLIVICHNYSRIGTDIDHSTSALKDIDFGRTSVAVLHMTEPHALPYTNPTDALVDAKYRKFKVLIDFAFTPERGLYDCNMNKSGLKKLDNFLKLYITEKTSWQYWSASALYWFRSTTRKVYHWARQNPRKAGVVAVISVFGFWWILLPAGMSLWRMVYFQDDKQRT